MRGGEGLLAEGTLQARVVLPARSQITEPGRQELLVHVVALPCDWAALGGGLDQSGKYIEWTSG
ncbi:hypothetical protein AQJ54_08430 [Streptomyces griseorubiginosus]|uniref:Uncharacterized protein n=1 Tax=Streptomyces griseorubiginosus TaxID=67304 RepID=A0A101S8W7_9ACTN|nr:hypothetical protein AQJ54_08430 [Streptomyces griseorubiginosus]